MSCKTVVLCILDGWGHREPAKDNAITQALTPHWDAFWKDYPHSFIEASETHVGLPEGQMGNSEVGHMNIGAGRIVLQGLPRIDHAFATGDIRHLPDLKQFINKLQDSQGSCHLMGLLSDGGVHSHINHLLGLCEILHEAQVPVWVHGFLDGRDTPPQSAERFLKVFLSNIEKWPHVKLATLGGRYYGMDRDNRWERIALAEEAILKGNQSNMQQAENALEFLQASYESGVTDEFVKPIVMNDYPGVSKGDALLMANFRADRVRQILDRLLRKGEPLFSHALGMAEYSEELTSFIPALFKAETPTQGLGEAVASAGLKQLRLAETEKYAHVTFFFNGGREEPFFHEDRILVPSPKVATYDLKPEMSAYEVTEAACNALEMGEYSLIVMNYANADMVGHTGNLEASRRAVEVLDECLGKLNKACNQAKAVLLITADHGNIEQLEDEHTHGPHTAHTCNQVPLVLVGEDVKNLTLQDGKLSDIAPTVLKILGLKQPEVMTGRALI